MLSLTRAKEAQKAEKGEKREGKAGRKDKQRQDHDNADSHSGIIMWGQDTLMMNTRQCIVL